MGILRWAIAGVTLLLVVAIIVIASWFVREHDKRANYYKKELQICWRNQK